MSWLSLRNLLAGAALLGAGGVDPFTYRDAWLHTIYVATTGNDTTGNGSRVNPYASLTKAMTVAAGGDGILLADGTYAENTSASGALRFNF